MMSDRVIGSYAIEGAAGVSLNIVILDACRTNPWQKSGRSFGITRGLAVLGNAPQGPSSSMRPTPGA